MINYFIWLLSNCCQVDTHKYSYRLVGKYDDGIYSVLQRKPLGSDEDWVTVRKIYPDEM